MEKKKKYELAEVETIHFNAADVIATSIPEHGDSGGDGGGWTNPDKPYISWS